MRLKDYRELITAHEMQHNIKEVKEKQWRNKYGILFGELEKKTLKDV